MRPPVPTHPDDDRLLELAYGETPTAETRALRQHVDGCARCRQVLEGIAEVRSAFRSVPAEPAPERGLESLLAYGEQAAARARSRRGGLRILALLSAATAFAVVWLVLPPRHAQPDGLARPAATPPTDALAQAEVRSTAAKGDRARDELDDRAKDAPEKENERKMVATPAAPLAKSEELRQEKQVAERRAEAEPPKQKGLSKLDAPAAQPLRAPGRASSDLAGGTAAVSDLSGALGNATASGGKVGTAPGPAAGAGAGAYASGAVAMKKRSAGGRADEGSTASPTAPASPPASVVASTSPEEKRAPEAFDAVDSRTHEAAKIAATPLAEAVAGKDKAASNADAASGAPARTAAKPAPPMQSARMGAGSPEKQARLGEIRTELETATGDRRKALLLEKCELEASLTLGPDAVLTCSTVTREFPGTPEAKRASELARGFSLQPPPAQER
ncbi:MAG TPA: hypothetical protein VGF31_02215 [Myxococcaceae bacterium]